MVPDEVLAPPRAAPQFIDLLAVTVDPRAELAAALLEPCASIPPKYFYDALGSRLFERTPDGHRLTTWGQHLLPMAQSMADAATAIDRRRMTFGDDSGGVVRLAAGEWVARFLAPRLATVSGAQRDLTVELALVRTFPPVATPRSLVLVHLRTALWFHANQPLTRFVTLERALQAAASDMGLPTGRR